MRERKEFCGPFLVFVGMVSSPCRQLPPHEGTRQQVGRWATWRSGSRHGEVRVRECIATRERADACRGRRGCVACGVGARGIAGGGVKERCEEAAMVEVMAVVVGLAFSKAAGWAAWWAVALMASAREEGRRRR